MYHDKYSTAPLPKHHSQSVWHYLWNWRCLSQRDLPRKIYASMSWLLIVVVWSTDDVVEYLHSERCFIGCLGGYHNRSFKHWERLSIFNWDDLIHGYWLTTVGQDVNPNFGIEYEQPINYKYWLSIVHWNCVNPISRMLNFLVKLSSIGRWML